MLTAAGALEIEGGEYAATIALERSFRLYAIAHRGVVWDSRFERRARTTSGSPTGLYLLLGGWVAWHERSLGTLEAPAAFVAGQEGLDGFSGPQAFTRTVGGDPYRALQLVQWSSDKADSTRAPAVVRVPDEVFRAANEVLDAVSSEECAAAIVRFLDRTFDAGLTERPLSHDIVPAENQDVQRLWDATSKLFLQTGALPSLKQVAQHSQLSTRQMLRAVVGLRSQFRLGWRGWRDITGEVRLRRAVLMLSIPDLPISRIASTTGYGSNDALALAFRRARLPPPSEVRALMLPHRDRRRG